MSDEYPHVPRGSVVVGHDGSEHSLRTLQQAITLAEAFATPLVVVRVWQLDANVPEYTQLPSGADSIPELTGPARSALEADTVRSVLETECEPTVSAHPSIAVSYEAALGTPAEVLTAISAQAQALVLVLGSRGRGGYVASFDEVSSGVREELITDVAHLSERYGTVAVSYFGVLGDPGESLVRESTRAALLVVGSRGRGGFTSLLLGSVSAYCAHRAVCPTLVVPRIQ